MVKVINLDTVRKQKNGQEHTPEQRAVCDDIVVTGNGAIIRKLIDILLSSGYTGDIEVRRGDTVVFKQHDISLWQDRDPLLGDKPEHLKKD